MPTSTPQINRRTRCAVAARVPCDERTVAAYLDPARRVSAVAEHHVRRALAELGLPDPRAERRTALGEQRTAKAKLARATKTRRVA